MFLHCGMLVLFWYFSSEFGFSTGIHSGCHMEILRTKKVFIQPTTEAMEGFAKVIPCQSLSTTLAWSVAELMVPSAPSVWCSTNFEEWIVSFWNLLSFFFFCFSCWEHVRKMRVLSYLSVWLMEIHVVFKLIWSKCSPELLLVHRTLSPLEYLNLNLREPLLLHVQLRGLLRSCIELDYIRTLMKPNVVALNFNLSIWESETGDPSCATVSSVWASQ